MLKNKKSLCLLLSAVTGAAVAVWRCLIFADGFITEENRFAQTASGENTAAGIVLLILAAAFFAVSLTEKSNGPACLPEAPSLRVSALVTAAFLALSYPLSFILMGSDTFSLGYGQNMQDVSSIGKFTSYLPPVAIIPAVIYLCAFFARSDRRTQVYKGISVFPAIWAIFCLMRSYFDLRYTFGDSNRLICNMLLIAVTFRFLMETRYLIKAPRPRLFLIFSCLSVLLGCAYVIPSVVMTAVGVIPVCASFLIELPLIPMTVYFFISSYKWAIAENADVLPDGETEEDADVTEEAEETETSDETATEADIATATSTATETSTEVATGAEEKAEAEEKADGLSTSEDDATKSAAHAEEKEKE